MGKGSKFMRGNGYEVQKKRCGRGMRCVRPVRKGAAARREVLPGQRGERVQGCLAEFAAQILAAYEVTGGEEDA